MRCLSHDRELIPTDMNGVTFCWPDETPFDPQPMEWECPVIDCRYHVLTGLAPEQRLRLEALRQVIRDDG